MARVTISDVARRAGVSPTAVSFTFNRPWELSRETVQRVLAASRELGYAPNPHAKALLSRRSGVMGLLVPESIADAFANPFYASFVQGVGRICNERELSMMVVSPIDESIGEAITRAPADGFLVVGLGEDHKDIAPLARRGVPFVVVDGTSRRAPSVNVEDERGAYEAASLVLSHGHDDIVLVSFLKPERYRDDPYQDVGQRRLAGYRKAFEESGVAWEEVRVVDAPCSLEGGRRCLLELWENERRPTAFICMSDVTALGILSASRELGLRVPEDLEVVGFDDLPMSGISCPPLSTVHQPTIEKGAAAASLLVRAIEGADVAQEHLVLPTTLVVRGSTRQNGAPAGTPGLS
ncbi:LacI family DNA-binding transcriptional regulator [Rubrobacter calidifluminis]|uniref:LacI family DNA-binding transcriptional regulator n=1 Tax=Rubrobacter calidifluminis TaxID=1392640 RepID=UPI002360EE33|nr:LacI family DNA-binding transcriptional regulator [Rubrobacter calidifluminis]